jgi:hypothetical protein
MKDAAATTPNQRKHADNQTTTVELQDEMPVIGRKCNMVRHGVFSPKTAWRC